MNTMRWMLLCLFSGIWVDVYAVPDYKSTPEEAAMCEKRVYSRRRETDRNWIHMHHYCDGLRFYERALRARGDKADFKYNVKVSVGNFEYVLTHTAPDFYMRPEVLVMQGRSYELGGMNAEASQRYVEALRLDPNLSIGYAALGNYYARNGDKDGARRTFLEGLKRSPKNRYLQSRIKALGGEPVTTQE